MKKRVLVVDDEPDFLEVITARLQANNYDVISVSNGKEALLKIEQEKPDAVLLDIVLPEPNGLEILIYLSCPRQFVNHSV